MSEHISPGELPRPQRLVRIIGAGALGCALGFGATEGAMWFFDLGSTTDKLAAGLVVGTTLGTMASIEVAGHNNHPSSH